MAEFESLKPNQVGLVSTDENGVIYQIALTKEQSDMLNFIVASMSKDSPLLRLPSEYDLELKNK